MTMYKESRQVQPQLGGSEMEKKTIGKFILALRRANGMTQKEKLYVEDADLQWMCTDRKLLKNVINCAIDCLCISTRDCSVG